MKKNLRIAFFLIYFVLISAFFFLYHDINEGFLTDSYIVLRIARDPGLLLNEKASAVFNENPVYPIFIKIFSVFFTYEQSAIVINFLALFISAVFFHLIVRDECECSITAFLTTVFLLSTPVISFWTLRIMPDILFLCAVILLLYSVTQKKVFYAYIIFAISLFVRNEAILLTPVLFYGPFFRQSGLKKSVVYLIFSFLPLLLFSLSGDTPGTFNILLALRKITEIPLKEHIINHLSSFPYVFQLSALVFLTAGIVYFFRIEKKKKNGYLFLYIFIIYLCMNFFWSYVQYRHYIPFLPGLFFFVHYFFKFMIRESRRHSKILQAVLIALALYTAGDIARVGLYRIHAMKGVMADVHKAGQNMGNLGEDSVYVDTPFIYKFFSKDLVINNFNSWETILERLLKKEDFYFVLSKKNFTEEYDMGGILIPVKEFNTSYISYYPFAYCNRKENSWDWYFEKGKMINSKTRYYKLDKYRFVMMFGERAFKNKDYRTAIFYFENAMKLLGNRPPEILKNIKICYFFLALSEKDRTRKKEYAEKGLEIEVYNDLNENLRSFLE